MGFADKAEMDAMVDVPSSRRPLIARAALPMPNAVKTALRQQKPKTCPVISKVPITSD
ncbi:hypothetical protein [Bradyrhizobium sp. JYMT SZCCT0180]|uniref:hypothetical protein n=1 Tax=Bradyrhizobium sp. JYMT SZCCT0180 TaxID=2807666 RepID=UPI001BA895D5|nr:hypothetical protein [Bradyrhizobium sp. JYMT SZCCT0180]MBR1211251.1 hypothetical protein [Bradyrhizobium sp. JYMT SZCCT0180]